MEFVEKPYGTLKVRVQYDTNGNVWRNGSGVDKGQYKNVSFGVSATSDYGDILYDTSETAVTKLFSEVLGFNYDDNPGMVLREVEQVSSESV